MIRQRQRRLVAHAPSGVFRPHDAGGWGGDEGSSARVSPWPLGHMPREIQISRALWATTGPHDPGEPLGPATATCFDSMGNAATLDGRLVRRKTHTSSNTESSERNQTGTRTAHPSSGGGAEVGKYAKPRKCSCTVLVLAGSAPRRVQFHPPGARSPYLLTYTSPQVTPAYVEYRPSLCHA